MYKKKKIDWVQVAKRGIQQPLLTFDAILEDFRRGMFSNAHNIKWSPKNFRQLKHARWFGKYDMEKYQSFLEAIVQKNPKRLSMFAQEYSKRIKTHKSFVDKHKNTDFLKYTHGQLAVVFEEWYELTVQQWCFAYDYIFINKFLPDIVVARVVEQEKDLQKQIMNMKVLFETDTPTEIRLEKQSLIHIAQLMRNNRLNITSKKIKLAIKRHMSEFAHLGLYYFNGAAYTYNDIAKRVIEYRGLSLIKIKAILKDFKLQDNNRAHTARVMKELKFNTATKLYVRIIKQWAWLSSCVDETYGYAVYNLMPLWNAIMKNLDISYQELYSLAGSEVADALKKGKISIQLKRDAKLRSKHHGLLLENGKKRIIQGSALGQYGQDEVVEKISTKQTQKITGQSASRGKVAGVVRIINTVHDLARVGRGEILVASSTNPTYVPAMERAAAIITDEGGLLSHAAIVSRELSVPCIVGTKIATQVLKDGDKVEVDAEKGIVRKI